MGFYDKDGYLTIVGRSKDLIITGGLNVYPKEVESVIDELEGVDESAVIGIPHPDFGEGVTAVVVLTGQGAASHDEIRDRLRDHLAGFKVPRKILFIDALPRNPMGKVQKNILREKFSDIYRDLEA